MGEAKRRKSLGESGAPLNREAITRVGDALKKLTVAASCELGRDCYLHAALGQRLLADLGVNADLVAGFAAWRVGDQDGDVISHVPNVKGHIPEGLLGFAYHAWLTVGHTLIDYTTHTLRTKAAELDALDGGRTDIVWCPDYLVVPKKWVATYHQVAQGSAGLFYYERHPPVERLLAATFSLDSEDLAMARLILNQPDANVLGVNHMRS